MGKLRARTRWVCLLLARDIRGQALLEFAIVLPLLVVFVVGIYDFSGAFNQKQKIEQAALEGAIVAGAQPMSDIQVGNSTPDSLLPVETAIINSLIASGVVSGTCTPVAGTGGPGLTWTYNVPSCPLNLTITINRGWEAGTGAVNSPKSLGTIVSVGYPHLWQFDKVIQLLIPGANYGLPVQLTASATVHNQL